VLETIWVREEEIIDIISILDSNKATGPDKISNNMIISIKKEIAKMFTLILFGVLIRRNIVHCRLPLQKCIDGLPISFTIYRRLPVLIKLATT
jgi:hypothetical protein